MARCTHTWITRATATRELDRLGWPTGFWIVEETKACRCCPIVQTSRVRATRTKSPEQAMELYRGLTTHEPA